MRRIWTLILGLKGLIRSHKRWRFDSHSLRFLQLSSVFLFLSVLCHFLDFLCLLFCFNDYLCKFTSGFECLQCLSFKSSTVSRDYATVPRIHVVHSDVGWSPAIKRGVGAGWRKDLFRNYKLAFMSHMIFFIIIIIITACRYLLKMKWNRLIRSRPSMILFSLWTGFALLRCR